MRSCYSDGWSVPDLDVTCTREAAVRRTLVLLSGLLLASCGTAALALDDDKSHPTTTVTTDAPKYPTTTDKHTTTTEKQHTTTTEKHTTTTVKATTTTVKQTTTTDKATTTTDKATTTTDKATTTTQAATTTTRPTASLFGVNVFGIC